MHPARIVVVVAAALSAAVLVGPFATSEAFGTIDGIAGDAWPIVFVLLPVVALAVTGDRFDGWGPFIGPVVIGLGCAGFLWAVVKIADAVRAANEHGGEIGWGAWGLAATTLVIIVGGVLGLSRPE